jgi:hypothetical protein
MAFPVSPTEGQTFTENNTVWIYSAVMGQWNRSVINPLNETFYEFGGSATATGNAGEIQYTDGTNLAASPNLVWDDVNDELEVGGDVVLDDGGTYTTTLQVVTPTANRTISFPDATGTVALVAGSSGQVVYNNAGANAGVSSFTADSSGRLTNSASSASGFPVKLWNGTIFAGTTPHVLVQPSTASAGSWSASGTALGVNTAAAFGGNLLDLQVNGTSNFKVANNGTVTCGFINSSGSISAVNNLGATGSGSFVYVGDATGDTRLNRDAANILAQRNAANAQTFRVYNTFTDASNYERLSTTWSSNVCYTKPENAGTGSARLYVPVTGATTVSGLPAAATAGAGARAFVTDANATTFLSTVAGGGANKVPVVSDGTNWLIG